MGCLKYLHKPEIVIKNKNIIINIPGQETRNLEATELFSPIITLQPSEPKPIMLDNGILKSLRGLIKPL